MSEDVPRPGAGPHHAVHTEHESRGIVATGSEQQSSELAAEKSAVEAAEAQPGRPSTRAVGRPQVIHEGLPTQLPDIDPDETQEWLESFDAHGRRPRPRAARAT